MTIHHDKLAYGRLAPTSEDLSEERLARMLAELNGGAENGGQTDGGENAEADGENSPRTSENGAYTAPDSNKKRKKQTKKPHG